MVKYIKYAVFIIFIIFIGSCKKNRHKVNLSGVNIDTEIIRFDNELLNIPTRSFNFRDKIEGLRNSHPGFFDLFTYRMIRIGGIEDSLFFSGLTSFLSDSTILNVKKKVEDEFQDFYKTEDGIIKSLRYYHYHFPKTEIPEIYTCISGFNQSVVIAENLIGVSLEKYLGPSCEYYSMLGIHEYKQKKMYKERIPVDMMYGWAKSEFIKSNNESNLLSHMIYEGKLLYFIDAMFPDLHDSVKIGYSAKQIEWCCKNEAQMWTNLIENKRLYTSKRMDIKRLIDDAPYTNGFPTESPGRAGAWIGWQIVRKYCENNPEITLPELMELDDSQKILNDSRYYPQ